MALTILNQTRRFSWPFIASAGLHASLVAALLYATVPPMSLPSAVEQPMIVMLVALDPQPVVPEPEVAPQPVPEPEHEPVPEPPAPVQVPKPVPKPKPERHREIKPRTPKPETRPASPAPSAPPVRPATAPVTSAPASSSVKSASSAPRATFRSNPIYPPRARALGIEGRISVMYDVNAEGRVENIRIVAAQPRNMFERDVRLAMRRWTYETGKPTANMTVKFQFDIQGVSSGD